MSQKRTDAQEREEFVRSQLARMNARFGVCLTELELKHDFHLLRRVRALYAETARRALSEKEHVARLNTGLFNRPVFKNAPTAVKSAVHGALQVMHDMLYQSLDGSGSPLMPVVTGPDGRIFAPDGCVYEPGDAAQSRLVSFVPFLVGRDSRISQQADHSSLDGESLDYARATQIRWVWQARWRKGELKYFC